MNSVWETKTIGDLCQVRPAKSEARNKLRPEELVSFAGMEDLGIDRKLLEPRTTKTLSSVDGSYTYFADGDVLLAKITPCFENGKLGIAHALTNAVGFGSSEFMVLRPSSDLDKEYLYYYLLRPDFRSEGASKMGGAVGQQRVPREFVEKYPIPLPPVKEQRRIVVILDKAFAAIATTKANTEKNLLNARALIDSSIDSTFSRPGIGWLERTLEESVEKNCTLSYGIVQPGIDVTGGLPIVRPTDLTTKVIELSGLKRIAPALAQGYQRTLLGGGEILLCVRGSTGTISIASSQLKGANVTRGIVPIRFNDLFMEQELGYYMLRSRSVQSQIQKKTYGAALMQINIRDLRNISLQLPPRTHQEKMLNKLRNLEKHVEELESMCIAKLSALKELANSTLQNAFSGGV